MLSLCFSPFARAMRKPYKILRLPRSIVSILNTAMPIARGCECKHACIAASQPLPLRLKKPGNGTEQDIVSP